MQDTETRIHGTICFPITENKILLGMKKRGFGQGNYNGFGGKKQEEDKNIEGTAVRELAEESGLTAEEIDLEHRATLYFRFPYRPEWNQRIEVYFLRKWTGESQETEEMTPKWFDISDVPYTQMWDADRRWMPPVLQGRRINATFTWKEDNKTVDSYTLEEI